MCLSKFIFAIVFVITSETWYINIVFYKINFGTKYISKFEHKFSILPVRPFVYKHFLCYTG